jgi:hypothetical protein
MSIVWRSAHTEIDGMLIDRDRGYPDLELVMEPVGTGLPKDQQSRELTIRVGSRGTTKLDEKGIAALRAFLDEVP